MMNLFAVLLVLSVAFGIKSAWSSRLRIAARREIVGPLARKLGWCLIAMPLFAVASVAGCILVLKLMGTEPSTAYGQGSIFGIAVVLLATAYVATTVRKYGVPMKTGEAPLDWSNIPAKGSSPDFSFLHRADPPELPKDFPNNTESRRQ